MSCLKVESWWGTCLTCSAALETQARSFRTYKGTTLAPLEPFKQVHLKVHWLQCKFFFSCNLPSIFTKKLVENHEYRIKDFKVHVSRQANHSQFANFNLNSCFYLSRKFKTFNPVSRKNPLSPLSERNRTSLCLSCFCMQETNRISSVKNLRN